MAADGSVVIEILGDDSKFTSKLQGLAGGAVKGLTTAVTAAAAAVTGLAAGAAKVGSEFESTMAATSTMFGDVAVDTAGLNAKILELSGSTGVAANEIGGSLYNALSAGIPVTEDMGGAMDYMESCTKLAKAGFTDVDTAVTATAKILNAYGMDVSEVGGIHKILMQTQNKGITTVNELGASLAQVTPTAAAMSVGFDQVGAALANMTAAGTPTAQATTQLNSLFAELGRRGTTAQKGLESALEGTEYAGRSFQDLMADGVPLNTVLDLMGDYAAGSGRSMLDLFSSIEGGKAALALAGENSAKFTENLAAMSTEADVVGSAFDKVTDTLKNRMDTLKGSVSNLGIAVYGGMEAPLKDAAAAAADMVGQITRAFTEGGLESAVGAVGGVLAQLAAKFASAAPGMIDAGVTLIQSLLAGLRDNLPELTRGAVSIVTGLADGIIALLPQLADVALELLTALAGGVSAELPALIPAAVEAVLTLAQGLVDNAPLLSGAGIQLFTGLADGLIAALPMIIEALPDLITGIVDALLADIDVISRAGAELLAALVGNLPEIIASIVKVLPDIVMAIAEGFWGLSDSLCDVGVELIKGLWEGIKSMGGWIRDKVSGFFGGIIDGVKEVFGIHSPSTVFAEIGRYDMRGLELGVTKKGASSRRAILAQMDALKDGMAAALNGGSFTAKYGVELSELSRRMRAAVSAETGRASMGVRTAQTCETGAAPAAAPGRAAQELLRVEVGMRDQTGLNKFLYAAVKDEERRQGPDLMEGFR